MVPVWVLPTVIGVTFIISLATQLINYFLVDQELVKSKRKRMKELQQSIKPGVSKEVINKAQAELLTINSELMKLTMKPTLYTMLPLLGLFWILSSVFKPYGDLITLNFNLPLFGTGISWLGTYIIFSFIFSLILKPLITKIGDKYGKSKK